MTWFQSIILGIVQGLTEFLPVSSSGHLAITQYFFNVHPPLFIDVFVHLATLCATVLVFRKKIFQLCGVLPVFVANPLKASGNISKEHHAYIQWLMISTVVTAIFGLSFKNTIEKLSENIVFVAGFLFCNGIILFLFKFINSKHTNPIDQLPINRPFYIGLAQSLALIPGISRSGMTIASSLLSGMSRRDAGEYAFLLSIPAIFGAFLLTLKDDLGTVDWTVASLSFIAAFTTGFFCLKLFLRWVEEGKLWMFGLYCCLLGLGLGLRVIL